jgi:NADH-quinone oxidoreductase subunit C
MTIADVAARLTAAFPGLITVLPEFRGETTLLLSDRTRVADVARWLKSDCRFDYLVDISSVDNLGREPRWEVVYEFYSYADAHHLRLKTLAEEEQSVPSLVPVFATADWHEREIFDMMGIRFDGHPDLRRILMWDGYPYYPLRKDFPLEGLPTELPDDRFTDRAPLAGGPFVTSPAEHTGDREPRSREPDR